jgi:hypothetical protein
MYELKNYVDPTSYAMFSTPVKKRAPAALSRRRPSLNKFFLETDPPSYFIHLNASK